MTYQLNTPDGETHEYDGDTSLANVLAMLSDKLPETITISDYAARLDAMLPPGFEFGIATFARASGVESPAPIVAPVRNKRTNDQIADDTQRLTDRLKVRGPQTAGQLADDTGFADDQIRRDLANAPVTVIGKGLGRVYTLTEAAKVAE